MLPNTLATTMNFGTLEGRLLIPNIFPGVAEVLGAPPALRVLLIRDGTLQEGLAASRGMGLGLGYAR